MFAEVRDKLLAFAEAAGPVLDVIKGIPDYLKNFSAYGMAAWQAAQYFYSPKYAVAVAALALCLLLLRFFLRGPLGWLVRTAIYVGLVVFLASAEDFVSIFAEPKVAYGVLLVWLIALWAAVTLIALLIKMLRRSAIPVESRSAPRASGGEAFNVQRNQTEQKQLVVVMMTDIVGYSARMEKDETATYALLKEHNVIMRRSITTHRGREIKTIGDAFMVVFMAPIDALNCAVAMQKALHALNKTRMTNDHLKVRIGLYQGEAVVTEKDVFGETVNIAARMESITEPGGISCSANIYDAVKGKVDVGFQSIGIPKMKNIANPPEVFRVNVQHG